SRCATGGTTRRATGGCASTRATSRTATSSTQSISASGGTTRSSCHSRRSSVPSRRVISHHTEHDVAALFRQVQCVFAQHRVLIAAQSVKGNDQGGLFVFRYFGRDEHRVRHLFVGVLERIGPLLNAGIDSSAPSSPCRRRRCRAGSGLLAWLLSELNF